MIQTGQIHIAPFEMKYLADYYHGFDREVTKFQWPEPFETVGDAETVLRQFLDEMDRGETLFLSILSKSGTFLGSVEVHGLTGACPELGVWVTGAQQRKGYAYLALRGVLGYVRARYGKDAFFYEADVRNTASMKLLRKFAEEYEITDGALERLTTDSGKRLELQGYVLKAK